MFSATLAENRKLSSATKATCERSERTSTDAHVGAVDLDRAAARVVQPREERHEAGLARSRGPDERHGRPALDGQIDVLERGRAAVVRERDAAQRRLAPARRGAAARSGGLSILGSRSRISNRRFPEATARCAMPSDIPSMRIGTVSMIR